jgi:hypothetical protein
MLSFSEQTQDLILISTNVFVTRDAFSLLADLMARSAMR